jgi:hypothetical protein
MPTQTTSVPSLSKPIDARSSGRPSADVAQSGEVEITVPKSVATETSPGQAARAWSWQRK